MDLAVEAVIPIVGGCAGALVAGAEGGLVGVAVAQAVEKAITFFGPPIVTRWVEWLRGQPPAACEAALAVLADMPPEQARQEAEAAIERLAPDASPADRSLAASYLAAIPQAVQASLGPDRAAGLRAVTRAAADPAALLRLLPCDAPPYPAPGPLPGSEYRLEELVGTGGFGAVYRGSTATLQYLPVAIKFCLDASLVPALRLERSNLERLMQAGGEAWSPRVVRLYGYNLDHATPYLVYEYAPGGNLARWLAGRQARGGVIPAEVLGIVTQVAEALAFAHARGLVHRDLKPANVLFDGGAVKLADFGIGGLVSGQVVRSGLSTPTRAMTVVEQVSMYRGAGTPLYMSVEQRRGEAPDPRQDLYSLGVMWYQLLAGDVTRELHPGWARELETKFSVPRAHIELIQRCVGWVEDRPRAAGELLETLRGLGQPPAPVEALPRAVPTDEASDRYRRVLLTTRMKQLVSGHRAVAFSRVLWWPGLQVLLLALVLALPAAVTAGALAEDWMSPSESYYGYNSDGYYRARDRAFKAAWVAGLGMGLGVLGCGVWAVRWQWRRSQLLSDKALASKLDEIRAEFPQEWQTWGGRTALGEAEIATEVCHELQASRRSNR